MIEHKNRPGQKGFSLIETIMVIVVLGIASYGLLNVFISGLRESASPLQGVQAIELAKEKLETIFSEKFDTAKGYSYLAAGNYPPETPINGFAGFNRTVTFTEVSGTDLVTPSPGSGFKRITVTVSWGSDSVTLESVAADY